jgi:hypothetical protein
MKTRILLAILLLTFAASIASAEPRRVRSGPERGSLVELYTSEGCSSCPSADEYVNKLGKSVGDTLLPLAFHVDYWDELGWPDPFAQRSFSERQRVRSRSLYTPEIMLNGREVDGGSLRAPTGRPAATIELALDGTRATVQASGGARLFLALSESNLAVDIKAGENRGRKLRHDHVVRKLYGPFPAHVPVSQVLGLAPSWKKIDLSLTAFVEDEHGQVLEAVRLPLAQ